jgi:TRAP transporter TAXI family solute receptor
MSVIARIAKFALLFFIAMPTSAQEIVILTGGTSGVYYPLGNALKKIFERDIPNSKVSAVSTQATVENLNLLQQGKGVLALAQSDVLAEAWKGNPEAGFPSSRTKIRLVGAAYPNYIHIIARREANIKSVFDLKGKRVSVGAARSGNELNARALLGAAKISYADLLQVEYLEYGQTVDLIIKGATRRRNNFGGIRRRRRATCGVANSYRYCSYRCKTHREFARHVLCALNSREFLSRPEAAG